MSETLPEGVSRQEFDELMRTLREHGEALQELREARTSEERADAREEVQETRADLDSLAKDLGISPAKLRDAAEKARRDERKEELRPLVLELLDEELTASDPPADEPNENDPPTDEKPEQKPEPKEGPEDTAPVQPHWSERNLGELLK